MGWLDAKLWRRARMLMWGGLGVPFWYGLVDCGLASLPPRGGKEVK